MKFRVGDKVMVTGGTYSFVKKHPIGTITSVGGGSHNVKFPLSCTVTADHGGLLNKSAWPFDASDLTIVPEVKLKNLFTWDDPRKQSYEYPYGPKQGEDVTVRESETIGTKTHKFKEGDRVIYTPRARCAYQELKGKPATITQLVEKNCVGMRAHWLTFDGDTERKFWCEEDQITMADKLKDNVSQERKDTPVYSGFMSYFPRAIQEVARLSKAGNDKHNPGQPLHWSKDKSADHADCIARHQLEHDQIDEEDGFYHDVKVAWRAMAQLETRLERDG